MAVRVWPATAQDHDGWHAMRVALYGADATTAETAALLRDPQQAAYVAELEDGHLGGFVEVGLLASDALLDNLLSHAVHRALGYTEVERHVCFYKRLAD